MMTGFRCTVRAFCAGSLRSLAGSCSYLILNSVAIFASYFIIDVAHGEVPKAFPGAYVVTLPESRAQGGAFALSASGSLPRGVQVADYVSSNVAVVQQVATTARLSIKGAVPIDPRDTFCKDLVASGTVTSCSPNYEVKVLGAPNDPSFSRLYGLSSGQGMDAPRAWELTTGSREVVVGVVDTGIDYDHPDLHGNMWRNPGETAGNGIDDDGNGIIDDVYGYNAILNSGDPKDDNIHGTHCAGTIGAIGNNGVGIVGVNHKVQLMALKFLDKTGSGSLANAIKTIDYAIAAKQKYGIARMVLSNSWGGGGFSQPLSDAIGRAKSAGIVFVAAAGNESNDNDANPSYPASYDFEHVVSVAAVDKNGNLASFSNFGGSAVDIAAAGVDILSTAPNGGYASLSGTSMATPHVAGALALLWSHESSLSVPALITRLYESGRTLSTLYDTQSSTGLVRTQRVVDVGRMLFNETAPIPAGGDVPTGCGYDFTPQNLALGGEGIDTAADNQAVVNQADEGSFFAVPLKFSFPYFNGTAQAVYLSPNGVVYVKAPTGLDYQVGEKAPLHGIAALHTDLTPTKSHHGIRVYSGVDKATILWTAEHYANQGKGDVQVRLTLYPSGLIKSSISFGASGESSALRKSVLGDPFSNPASSAKALVGLTGTSSVFSSTVDLAAAQTGLIASGNEPLTLGVTMRNNCPGQDGGSGEGPHISRITLKEQSKRKVGRSAATSSLVGVIHGTGSGVVPLRVTINRTVCQQSAQVQMSNGQARFTARLPKIPVKLTVSSAGVSKSLKMRSSQTKQVPSASRIQLMCRTVLGALE